MSEWKSGDVAMVRSYGSMEWFRAICTHWYGEVKYDKPHWISAAGRHYNVAEVRPVAGIDPEDREQVERLRDLYDAEVIRQIGDPDPRDVTPCDRANALQAALREFASPKPPKPEEPTGLGAVVRTADSELYVRDKTTTTVAHWKRARGEERGYRRRWDDLPVVEVLRKGWPS